MTYGLFLFLLHCHLLLLLLLHILLLHVARLSSHNSLKMSDNSQLTDCSKTAHGLDLTHWAYLVNHLIGSLEDKVTHKSSDCGMLLLIITIILYFLFCSIVYPIYPWTLSHLILKITHGRHHYSYIREKGNRLREVVKLPKTTQMIRGKARNEVYFVIQVCCSFY